MAAILHHRMTILAGRYGIGGVYQGLNGQTITGNSSGAWAIAASGTNQSITLTPSGTGRMDVIAAANGIAARIGAASEYLSIGGYTPNSGGVTLGFNSTQYFGLNAFFGVLLGRSYIGGNLTPPTDGMAIEGKVLLGTTTDSSNGRLQLASHTTSAGGIGLGTDTALFRNTAGRLSLAHTTRPQFDLEMGGTIGASWFHTSGGVFMDAGTGYGLSFRTNGTTTALTLDASQVATFTQNVLTATGKYFGWTGRGGVTAPADGVVMLTNNAATDFSRLQFGGTTSSFPALKRNSTELQVRLADDSAFAGFTAAHFRATAAADTVAAGQISYGATTATTVGVAGAASALPANPLGYIIINVAGTAAKIPYYSN